MSMIDIYDALNGLSNKVELLHDSLKLLMHRPKLHGNGDVWRCGQDDVVGYGRTPNEAMKNFVSALDSNNGIVYPIKRVITDGDCSCTWTRVFELVPDSRGHFEENLIYPERDVCPYCNIMDED